MINRNLKLVIVVLAAWLMVWIFSFLLSGCNTFKPIAFKPVTYKDVLFLQWKADNEQGVINYTLQFSEMQKDWVELKAYKSGKGNYMDTINYLAGYYRIKVNLQSKSDSSNIVSVK